MRHFITAAILTVATMTGVQAKPPSGGQSGQGGFKQADFKKADFKKADFKQADFKKNDFKQADMKKAGQFGSGKYLTQHGKKFSQGYMYCGKDHCHWSYCCWWPKYGCNCYYCPDACCWYYWCEPRVCYLPVTCVEYAPPAVVNDATATATAVSNVTVNVGGAPMDLPPVVPSGPSGAGAVQPFQAGPVK